MTGDLPDLPINHLEVWNDTTLFIATDVGVYFTENGGGNWQRVGNNMPLIPVFDLEFNEPNMELVAATFSRSMMTFPLDSLIPEPVVDPVGVNELALQLNVYPNPTANGVWIEGLEQPGLLQVFNATGQVVLQRQLTGRSFVQLATCPPAPTTCTSSKATACAEHKWCAPANKRTRKRGRLGDRATFATLT